MSADSFRPTLTSAGSPREWPVAPDGSSSSSRVSVRGEFAVAPFLAPRDTEGVLPSATAALLEPGSEAAEQFRLLATRLRTRVSAHGSAVVGVVSAAPGEGKTTVSIGLAHALSLDSSVRVALVDLDLRRPSVGRSLGLPDENGVGEWLDGSVPGIGVLRPPRLGVNVAVAGLLGSNRFELLGSPALARALDAARRSFDFTILDLPPLAPVADGIVLQDLVDGFLLVVRSRHSPQEAIRAAVSDLRPDRILGAVWNDHRELIPGYGSYARRRYDQAAGSGARRYS